MGLSAGQKNAQAETCDAFRFALSRAKKLPSAGPGQAEAVYGSKVWLRGEDCLRQAARASAGGGH